MNPLNTIVPISGRHITESFIGFRASGLRPGSEGQKFASLFEAALAHRNVTRGASPGPPPPACYVVQPGDNLSKISRKLGIGNPLALARANNLADPDLLLIGQVLEIPPELMKKPIRPAATSAVSTVRSTLPGLSPPKPSDHQYLVQPGDNLCKISRKLGIGNPLALARANKLTDPDRLTIGQVLRVPAGLEDKTPGAATAPKISPAPYTPPTARAKPRSEGHLVVASWYGGWHHGRLMANGKKFDMFANTVAHKSLPFGTRLRLTNPRNGRSVIVTVTDRGPYIRGRQLDVSYGVARKLGMVQAGVAHLRMEKV